MRALGFDSETTGLEYADGHRILEIAGIFYNLSTGEKEREFAIRINPERSVSQGAFEVHGISYEMVAHCPTFAAIAPKLVAIFNHADVLVAHNGRSFDLPFLNHELMRVGQPIITKPLIDTMVDGRWATPFGKPPNLGELCFACGIDYDPTRAHAALYDVDVMMKAFMKARAKGFYPLPAGLEEKTKLAT